eukprot:5101634-Pyramimonas_sp.AAC.1
MSQLPTQVPLSPLTPAFVSGSESPAAQAPVLMMIVSPRAPFLFGDVPLTDLALHAGPAALGPARCAGQW